MSIHQPNVLIYKRTHKGDPDAGGIFGIKCCMGRVRGWEYDAVIGIGGKRPDKGCEDISFKVNWIGIGPTCHSGWKKNPVITFARFCLFEGEGPLLSEIAPKLFVHMYQEPASNSRRVVMSNSSLPSDIRNEVLAVLKLADKCAPSKSNPSEVMKPRDRSAGTKDRCRHRQDAVKGRAARKCR